MINIGFLQSPPELPKKLPRSVETIIRNVPAHMRGAVATGVFPALGAHVCNFRFVAANNTIHELAFMHLFISPQSAGKGGINEPIQSIVADIKRKDQHDEVMLKEWTDAYRSCSANDKKPLRPEGVCVQMPLTDMTPTAFGLCLADVQQGGNKVLYHSVDELDLLNQVRGNNITIGALVRLGFDRAEYGQVRATASGENIRTMLRWNFNASSTPQNARIFFRRSMLDGTISRLNVSVVPRPKRKGDAGRYDEAYTNEVAMFVDRLKAMNGLFENDDIRSFIRKMEDEYTDMADEFETDDEREAFLGLLGRSVAYGHMKAIMLYFMEGEQWTKEIRDFVHWSVEYDMWSKLYLFGDMMLEQLSQGNITPSFDLRKTVIRLLDELPLEFTKDQLVELRAKHGQSSVTRTITYRWVKDGLIEKVGTNRWRKKSHSHTIT